MIKEIIKEEPEEEKKEEEKKDEEKGEGDSKVPVFLFFFGYKDQFLRSKSCSLKRKPLDKSLLRACVTKFFAFDS